MVHDARIEVSHRTVLARQDRQGTIRQVKHPHIDAELGNLIGEKESQE